jgi:hypothetical protein
MSESTNPKEQRRYMEPPSPEPIYDPKKERGDPPEPDQEEGGLNFLKYLNIYNFIESSKPKSEGDEPKTPTKR